MELKTKRSSQDPARFTGAEANVKTRQVAYEHFKEHVELCHAIDSDYYDTDLLSGGAFELYKDDFHKTAKNPDNQALWHWETLDHVWETLDRQYIVVDLFAAPLPVFLAKFEALALRCKKTDVQKVDALELKVSDDITNVALGDKKPARDGYKGWVDFYQWFDEDVRRKQHDKQRTKGAPPGMPL
ncbi:hypothetical protein GGTG_13422 [Gaeumannomyces tritici R3-111a-1]|uniref:Uncharacterized protein n=1 Tax=Gaeumannomyces tritici (strain R3-111a-1) TaxID=644352 RepID=J3PIU2_GAET3|nr:hypothetical protein GGTG_13422 [Gaeumannomyces tritici R3-111a-1]EJT69025.1 hypothetical protein GGTG_13422 [Gaeumannomyces tritici R3-111a-1]